MAENLTSKPEVNVEALERELVESMELFGWLAGWPEHISAKSKEIDEAVCRRSSCPDCGRKNRKALAFRWKHGKGYRLVALCRSCGCHESM